MSRPQKKVPVKEGPVKRAGATGSIKSIYFRGPEKNLIEIAYVVASHWGL